MRSPSLLFGILFACIVSSGCVALSNSATICGDDWYYSMETSSCYYISQNSTPFTSAISYCDGVDSKLIEIFSAAEYAGVSMILEQYEYVEPYWIGLQTYEYSPYFRWLSRRNVNYTHWAGVTPSHDNRNACFAWSKTPGKDGWLQIDCLNPLHYICKRPAKINSVTRINGTSGTISSPNYPIPYSGHSVSYYYIVAPYSYLIELTFGFIGIDPNSFIYVYDNDTLIANITSQSQHYVIESNSNQLSIEFDAEKEGNEKYIGWTASFNAFVPVTMEGSYTSPNYPNYYGPDEYVTKIVDVPTSFGIIFTVWDFESEAGYDYLTIYANGYNRVVPDLTGNTVAVPYTFRTIYSEAKLIWTSNNVVEGRGFNLTWVADPNWG